MVGAPHFDSVQDGWNYIYRLIVACECEFRVVEVEV